MAKVEGSNPFIRFARKPRKSRGFLLFEGGLEGLQWGVGTNHGYQMVALCFVVVVMLLLGFWCLPRAVFCSR
jgi:hypothetical protein